MRRLLLSFTWAQLGALLVVLSGCAAKGTSPCGPSNCAGCCDAQQVCQSATVEHCGQGGQACAACAAHELCDSTGMCVAGMGSTGGSGSGGSSGTTGLTLGGTTGKSGSSSGGSTSGMGSSGGSGGSSGGELDGGEPDAGPSDGGFTNTCSFDAGPPMGGSCVPECNRGFHCENGACILNGGEGPLQVTLRFNQPEDLDLHVLEPGGCEVFYGNRMCVGSLDLDSNAGCSIDNVDTENVIYPPADGGILPPTGTYEVRVDFYANCNAAVDVPYEVIVRKNGVISTYCGDFNPAVDDHGSAGSGVTVATFTYP